MGSFLANFFFLRSSTIFRKRAGQRNEISWMDVVGLPLTGATKS